MLRQGITLLEVLISIGILAVGLLGLASLLPVTRFFMQDGSKYDRTSTLGQQGVKELEIRSDLMLGPWQLVRALRRGKFNEVCPETVTLTYSFGSVTYTSTRLQLFVVNPGCH